MSVIGIVGEYDPFHYGHLHHIDETKKLLGEDAPVVCVMSGDFIQRGEAAVYSKSARAEAAVKSGVNLVVELPLPWTLSSAEGFARGAVGLLGAIGVVTHLSFGSECGDIAPLAELAELLLDPMFGAELRRELSADEGISFAAARQRAVQKRVGDTAELLAAPNNILAVEYLKAIYDVSPKLVPLTVKRTGSGHDAVSDTGPRSASELRRMLAENAPITDFVPEAAYSIYRREDRLGRGPVLMRTLEPAILSRLRMLGNDAFAELPDAGEGLYNRLRSAAGSEPTLDAVLASAKTKRYAMSRIRRMTLCAALGIRAGDSDGIPPYARVLSADKRGCELLRQTDGRAAVPIITKPAAVKALDPECGRIFGICSGAHDLYALGFTAAEERRGGADWRGSPVIVR